MTKKKLIWFWACQVQEIDKVERRHEVSGAYVFSCFALDDPWYRFITDTWIPVNNPETVPPEFRLQALLLT